MNDRGKAKPKSKLLEDLRLAATNERRAVKFLEARRWADLPCCPRCGDTDVYQMRSRSGERETHFRWRCRGCKRQYSVRTNTVMEESRIPLKHWVHAFWRASASKKGVSALQIKRECQISYTTALYLMHRIRTAMGETGPVGKLSGTVEIDECYIGGKLKNNKRIRHLLPFRKGLKWGKRPVLAMIERDGRARAWYLNPIRADNLRAALHENVAQGTRIMTDGSSAYIGHASQIGPHEVVHRTRGEYARPGGIHINSVEGFFSILKHGLTGTYHQVSSQHLQKYLDEFAFRHSTRHDDDAIRTAKAIRLAEGKRLLYKRPLVA